MHVCLSSQSSSSFKPNLLSFHHISIVLKWKLWDSEGPGPEAIGIPRKGIKSAGESLLSGVFVMCACVVRGDTRNRARAANAD